MPDGGEGGHIGWRVGSAGEGGEGGRGGRGGGEGRQRGGIRRGGTVINPLQRTQQVIRWEEYIYIYIYILFCYQGIQFAPNFWQMRDMVLA